jgi:hypothetical protein
MIEILIVIYPLCVEPGVSGVAVELMKRFCLFLLQTWTQVRAGACTFDGLKNE